MTLNFRLGTDAFDYWLAESEKLRRLIETHGNLCPACKDPRKKALAA
jgi:hypothetical protein